MSSIKDHLGTGPLILCDCHSKTPPYGKIKSFATEALFEERGGRRAVHYGPHSRPGYQPREDLTPKECEEKPSPQEGWALHWW